MHKFESSAMKPYAPPPLHPVWDTNHPAARYAHAVYGTHQIATKMSSISHQLPLISCLVLHGSLL